MRRSVPGHFHTLEPFLDFFKTGVPILMYHKIGPRPSRVRLRGLYVRREDFMRQLDELHQAGFASCPPAQAIVKARSKGAPDRRVVLTFDDGFRNAFQNALEPLAQRQFHAIQFLVTNCIGKVNEWDLRDGEVPEPLMDAAQVGEWLRAGHRIGSHSLTHPRLTRLSLRDAQEEILASKK
jgi:peptidoglycan/xylan/chitin deacetylase (PgdA/CDA1 family)